MKPIGDKILVKRYEEDKISKGGIYIPAVAQEKSILATVVAVGPGRVLDSGARVEPQVKVGDTVILAKWAGNEIDFEGIKHVMIHEHELLAVVEQS